MNPLNNFKNITDNFWELNPQFKVFSPFKEFCNSDKSKGKTVSSTFMWGLAFLYERKNNKLYRISEAERIEVIESDILGCKFDIDKNKFLLDAYLNLQLTELEKDIYNLKLKLQDRRKLLLDTDYDLDNAKDLDSMFLGLDKLQELLQKWEDKLKATEGSDGEVKGGRKESAAERGEL